MNLFLSLPNITNEMKRKARLSKWMESKLSPLARMFLESKLGVN